MLVAASVQQENRMTLKARQNKMKVGIIAGYGEMPILIANEVKERGHEPFFICGFQKHQEELAQKFSGKIKYIPIWELDNLTTYLKENKIDELVMAGKFFKTELFEIKLDKGWTELLATLPTIHDEDVFNGLINHFEKNGVKVASQAKYIEDYVSTTGPLVGEVTETELADIQYGFKIAKLIADADIGQAVVVKRKTVFAVEAIEGTDAAILRGGQLAGSGAVVVKASRTNQDWRLDVPTIGAETVKKAISVGIRVLAVEAGNSFFLEKEVSFDLARKHGLAIYGYVK